MAKDQRTTFFNDGEYGVYERTKDGVIISKPTSVQKINDSIKNLNVEEMGDMVHDSIKFGSKVSELGMMAVLLSTGSIDEAMEVHDKLSSQENRQNCEFPKDCDLSDEQLKELGFEIIDNNTRDRYLRIVKIPVGWNLKHNNMMHNTLYDDKGRRRAWVMMDNRPWDRAARCSFNPRFSVGSYSPDGNYDLKGIAIYDAAGTEEHPENDTYLKISELRNVRWERDMTEEQRQKIFALEDEIKVIRGNYEKDLLELYPDYKNTLAYWD